jgi:hypothetical protein
MLAGWRAHIHTPTDDEADGAARRPDQRRLCDQHVDQLPITAFPESSSRLGVMTLIDASNDTPLRGTDTSQAALAPAPRASGGHHRHNPATSNCGQSVWR